MRVEDVLFELGCEELPSHQVLPLGQALHDAVAAALQAEKLDYHAIQFYATPRRIAVWVKQLVTTKPAQTVIKKGPPKKVSFDEKGNPTPALLGFAKQCQVAVEAIRFEVSDKGEWAYYEQKLPAVKTFTLLPAIFQNAVKAIPLSQPMYWESHTGPFVRPVHWVLFLWGKRTVKAVFFGIQSGPYTYGHRYHAPQKVKVADAAAYAPLLMKHKVIADFSERRNTVLQEIARLSKQCGAEAPLDEALVEEVTSIVEWPCGILGQFSPDFLALPQEVLITSMQTHQKCFPVFASDAPVIASVSEAIQPYFIAIANIESKDPARVIVGNERVISARLSDAAFFYQEDTKQPLKAFLPKLKNTLFQAKLGTLYDQVERLIALASFFGMQDETVKNAILLSKCDLMTGMVGEFPELQGVMGYYYAKASGESEAVALAMQEQYLPRFAQDTLPATELGWLLSVINRLDVLVGIFGIGQKPTGMKDPFKCRRHALALVRLLTQRKVSLQGCLEAAKAVFAKGVSPALTQPRNDVCELKAFILDRLPAFYATQGISADIVASVLAVESDDLQDIAERIAAIQAEREALTVLIAGAKRVTQILKTVKEDVTAAPEVQYFEEAAEKALYDALQNTLPTMDKPYPERLKRLYALCPQIDTFFEKVMVMAEDKTLQKNRLRLLFQMQQLLGSVADLSQLQ